MRLRSIGIISVCIGAIFAAVACSEEAADGDPDQDAPTLPDGGRGTPGPSEGTDEGCLGRAGLGFDDAECNRCMSDKAECCQATVACFKEDQGCATLHACMQACEAAGIPPFQIFMTEVYPSVAPTCASCHATGSGGAAIFFGTDAHTTYPLFKARSYHLADSELVTKGLHDGPALTKEQRAIVDKWVAAEAPLADMDAGADDGGSDAGMADSGANDDAGAGNCKDECKAKHPSSVARWQAYNTCAAVTCKAECL